MLHRVHMQSGLRCGSNSGGALRRDIEKLHSAATVLTEYSGIPAAIQVRHLYRNWVPAADKGVCFRPILSFSNLHMASRAPGTVARQDERLVRQQRLRVKVRLAGQPESSS